MNSSRGMSLPVILIIGSIISAVLICGIFLLHVIDLNFRPSPKNIERLMKQHRIDEALFSVRKIGSDSSKISLLKAKVWFFKALQNRKEERWKNYGNDEPDWFKSEEIDSAIVELKSVLQSTDRSLAPEAAFYLGQIYSEKGWFPEAEGQFLKVLRFDPKHKDVKLSLSSMYVKESRFSDAEKLLRNGFLERSTDPDVAKNMAFLFRYYIDLPESAIVWFNRYLNNAGPRDFDVNLARTEIEDLLQRYPEYAPSEPQNWRNRGKGRKFTGLKGQR